MAEPMALGDRIEFEFWEAGCMIWVGAKDFVSEDYEGFCNLIWNNDQPKLREAIFEKKAFLAMDLYQDDGYNVRVVMGDLNEQERDEWVARARWRLDLSCGKMLVSGVMGDDFDDIPNAKEVDDDSGCLHYTDFVVRLSPVIEDLPPSELGEGGTIQWEFRKPDRCPLGLTQRR
ncbi:MAG: hypothetical protein ACKPCM_08685 [Pseudanabaena sp.]